MTRFIKVLLCVFFLFPLSVHGAPKLQATAAILIELETGRVIYEKASEERRYPASLTKMMTALVAFERGDFADEVVFSARATMDEYSELSFREGDVLRLDEALEAMLLNSDNNAATAVAESSAKNYHEFVRLMNERAKSLGLTKTHFVNPHGLPDKNHYSTAKDLAIVAREFLSKPALRGIGALEKDVIVWQKPAGKQAFAENTNELLGSYPGAFGIKTGWTRAAGGCLAAAAERNGVVLIAVVLQSPTMSTRFDDMRKLFDYGFAYLAEEAREESEKAAQEEKTVLKHLIKRNE